MNIKILSLKNNMDKLVSNGINSKDSADNRLNRLRGMVDTIYTLKAIDIINEDECEELIDYSYEIFELISRESKAKVLDDYILNVNEYVNAVISNKFICDMVCEIKPGYRIFLTKEVDGTDYFGYKYKHRFVYLTDRYGLIKKYRNHNINSSKWEEI